MARTFHAEGRQITNYLRALFIFIGGFIYFKIPNLHWGFLCAYIIISTILAEIAGRAWTRWRRDQKKKSQQLARKTKAAQRKQTRTENSSTKHDQIGS